MFKDVIPYTPSALAQVVRHQVGTVEKALKIFQDLGLIEVLDNGAIYMLDIQNFIGKSSTEADRKRLYRAEIQKEVKMLGQMSDKTPPEIDIEIEKDVDNIYGQDELDQLGQKKETWEQQFEKFYRKYPKKVKKQDVKKWFIKNQPSDELFSFMMNKLEQFRGSADWQKDGGSYIPYPTTWLKQKRWEDEEIQKTQQNKLCNFGNQRDYGDMSFLYANQGGIINEK